MFQFFYRLVFSHPDRHVKRVTQSSSEHLLSVDDDPQLRELLARHLGEQGFRFSAVADARAMDVLLARKQSALIILDFILPSED